jgi:Carboxypeptidase regulatory-like domain
MRPHVPLGGLGTICVSGNWPAKPDQDRPLSLCAFFIDIELRARTCLLSSIIEIEMVCAGYLRLSVLFAFGHVLTAGQTGALTGRATDPNGAFLPFPKIRLDGQLPGGPRYEAEGNAQGQFVLDEVESGQYKLTVSVPGFARTVPNVHIAPGQHLDAGILRLDVACNAGVICDEFGLSIYNDPIHAQGSIQIPQSCAVDIDEGKSFCTVELDGRGTVPPARDAESDFWLRIGAKGEVYMTPRNGVTLALNPLTEQSKAACASAAYLSKEVRIDGLPIGSRVCVRTTRDRYAQVVFVEGVPLRAERVKMSFITWQGTADIPPLQMSPRR